MEKLIEALKILVSVGLFTYLLMTAVWPIHDEETGWLWKSLCALVFIGAMYGLWFA
jgi:hypothetical protein